MEKEMTEIWPSVQIVAEDVQLDASYHRGQTCARGHAGRAVHGAAAYRRGLPATMMPAPATAASPPVATGASAPERCQYLQHFPLLQIFFVLLRKEVGKKNESTFVQASFSVFVSQSFIKTECSCMFWAIVRKHYVEWIYGIKDMPPFAL